MIITRLWGGLGNQMFQYAAGRALSLRSGVPLKLDIYDLVDRTPSVDFVYRDCDLGLLMAPLDFASLADLGRAYDKPSSLRIRLALRYRKELFRRNAFKEKNQQFLPELFDAKKRHAHLMGYWQDNRYFEGFEDTIAGDFVMRGDHASDFSKPITECESVCLNVRRTDFVEIAAEREQRTECGEDYYRKAIDIILQKNKNIRIFGFSDDVEWCEKNLSLQKPVTWIPHSESGVKFGRYFWLMRQCKHFIIPNSTFAWWAAWLADNPNKMVICPKHWHNGDHSKSQSLGLIPKEWESI
jgi:hypothetical protein